MKKTYEQPLVDIQNFSVDILLQHSGTVDYPFKNNLIFGEEYEKRGN